MTNMGEHAIKRPARWIIYHGDADGCAAAQIASVNAVQKGFEPRCIEARYMADDGCRQAAGPDVVGEKDEIWIVDFSYREPDMRRFHDLAAGRLTWIDHHKTSIESLAACSDYAGLRQVGKAACELCWEYCNPGLRLPPVFALIADRDVWRLALGDLSHYFHAYLSGEDYRPGAPLWERLVFGNLPIGRVLDAGAEFYKRRIRRLQAIVRRFGRTEQIFGEGKTVMVVNYPGSGDMGQIIRDMGYDVAHCYVDYQDASGKLVREHSLYSSTVDVGAYAQSKGGGGHKGAAGWVEVIK